MNKDKTGLEYASYEDLWDLCRDTWMMLEHATKIDFRNGVEHMGMDEGDITGWDYYWKLKEKAIKWRIL
jgi:hypothetical protein